MRGFVVVGAVFPPQLLPSHLVQSTRFSFSAILLLLVLTVISVSLRSHLLSVTCRISSESKHQPANETSNKKGTRNDKETRKQTKTRPKIPLYPTFHQSLLHSYSIPFVVGADSPKSRPPRSYLRPGLTRRCSLLQSYPPCLSSPLDLRILRVHFSQSYPPNAPSSSAHRSRVLQVCFSPVVVKKNEISPPWPFV